MTFRLAVGPPVNRVSVADPHWLTGSVVLYVDDIATGRLNQRDDLRARNSVHRHRRRPSKTHPADHPTQTTRDDAAHAVAHRRREVRELLKDENSPGLENTHQLGNVGGGRLRRHVLKHQVGVAEVEGGVGERERWLDVEDVRHPVWERVSQLGAFDPVSYTHLR